MSAQPEALRLAETPFDLRGDWWKCDVDEELRRLHALNAQMLEALAQINEWCCYGAEKATAMHLLALQQIGLAARAAIAAAKEQA